MLTFRGLAQIALDNASISSFPDSVPGPRLGLPARISVAAPALEPLTVVLGIASASPSSRVPSAAGSVRRKYGLEDEPLLLVRRSSWSSWSASFWGSPFLLASYKGTPIVLVDPRRARRRLHGRHAQARSSAGTSTRSAGQSRSGHAVGHQDQARDLPALRQHGCASPPSPGLVFTAGLNLANPSAGTGFELDAISAVFIGGAAVTGGIGTVPGAIIGGLIIGLLNNGMSILGVGQRIPVAHQGPRSSWGRRIRRL